MKTLTAKKSAPKKVVDAELTDVTQVLHHDHQTVAEMFFEYSELEEDDLEAKEELAKTIVKELFVHAKVEEEIVYPAVRKSADDSEDMMDEADTEHHVVKLLMAEISQMKAGDDHFDSKVCVLGELVNHHVQEEEKEIFEELRAADLDLEKLGKQVIARKEELSKKALPKDLSVATSSRPASRK